MVVEQERRYKYENVCFEKQEAKQLSIINLNRQNNHLWLTYSGCNVKRSIAIDNYENLRKVVSCLDSNIKGFEKCVFCSDTKQQQSENLKDHIAICSTRLRDLTPEIEIYNCPLLEEIDLTGQQVPDLKITNCPNLKILKIKDSKITSLDLRNIPSLLEVETNPQCQVYFHPAYTDHQIAQQRERLINLEKEWKEVEEIINSQSNTQNISLQLAEKKLQLEQTIQGNKKSTSFLRKEITYLEKLNEQEQETKKTSKQIDLLKKDLDKFKQEAENYKNNLEQTQKKLQEKENQLSELQHKKTELEEEQSKNKEKIRDLTKQIKQLEQEKKAIEEKLNKETTEFQKKWEQKKVNWQTKIQELENKLETCQKEKLPKKHKEQLLETNKFNYFYWITGGVLILLVLFYLSKKIKTFFNFV